MNHLKDPPKKPIYGDHFTKASDSLFGRLLQTEVSAQPTYNCEQGIYCQWVSALKLAIGLLRLRYFFVLYCQFPKAWKSWWLLDGSPMEQLPLLADPRGWLMMVNNCIHGHDSWFSSTSDGSPILMARSTNPHKAHPVLCLTLCLLVRCWKVDSGNLSIPKFAATHSCKRHDEGKIEAILFLRLEWLIRNHSPIHLSRISKARACHRGIPAM